MDARSAFSACTLGLQPRSGETGDVAAFMIARYKDEVVNTLGLERRLDQAAIYASYDGTHSRGRCEHTQAGTH